MAAAEADADLWRRAQVDFGGVRQPVSLACLPQARIGDAVLVHVGVALSIVEEDPAP
ncbi:HypC/HybG/HupF family hydrogenase formation chaperone [Synechococcus sp. RSCCF101]|uniref:HypC/HybG/HupF family hydrogenase formation chaperone n=1 Tax=Synechococcus sp. RSCCF101 TaxID=2511069 RepID=UPI002108306A|nr:HypC/HybG/HupF family hydrogenase formation chaperone [Synechococcus sp. RSCCF101]